MARNLSREPGPRAALDSLTAAPPLVPQCCAAGRRALWLKVQFEVNTSFDLKLLIYFFLSVADLHPYKLSK